VTRFLSGVLMASLVGCSASRVTDPRLAAATFASAAARGDDATVYKMLSPEAQRALSQDDVKRLLKDENAELGVSARALAAPQARTTTVARLRFADGEEASLEWNDGHFGVASGGTIPGGGATPEAALSELRRALARRSYPALLRLLSPTTRRAVEQDLRTLVGGLEHPETLPVHTTGDSSNAMVPGGHHVTLHREGGIWRVEDFD
jgi:hypothetical protein